MPTCQSDGQIPVRKKHSRNCRRKVRYWGSVQFTRWPAYFLMCTGSMNGFMKRRRLGIPISAVRRHKPAGFGEDWIGKLGFGREQGDDAPSSEWARRAARSLTGLAGCGSQDCLGQCWAGNLTSEHLCFALTGLLSRASPRLNSQNYSAPSYNF
jgi:hypothetical protein